MGTRKSSVVKRWLALVAATGLVAGLASVSAPAASGVDVVAATAPATGSITLAVQSARALGPDHGVPVVTAGQAIPTYKWMINQDATGNPGTVNDQGLANCLPTGATDGAGNQVGALPINGQPNTAYADTCQWPSVRNTSGLAPIVAQGNQADLSLVKALDGLHPGKYLISVTAANYKIDGSHFTVTSGTTTPVMVQMNPTPLPLTTLRIQVFHDNIPVDATFEMDAEDGLPGFSATLSDPVGLVSTDYYGNALCTAYVHQDATDPASPIVFDAATNKPTIDRVKSVGKCLSDSTGIITIPNLGPNRYAATVTPPAPQPGQTYQWVQTNTLEGGHDTDIWQQEGGTGFDNEQTRGAELVPATQFGFVQTQAVKIDPAKPAPTGEIKGVAIAALPYIGGQNGQTAPIPGIAGAKSGGPIKSPWIALSDLNNGDGQIYVGRGGVDGSFDIKNVPDSTYQLSIWDNDQDYILWSYNVTVAKGALVNVGNQAIVGWFTHVYGKVFIDSNGNGKQDPGEGAVPQFALTVRERDNSLMDQGTNTISTDNTGFYNIREAYPMGKFLILEAFNTRYKTTGITYKGENDPTWTTKLGSLVDLNFLPIIGLGGEIDWGVQPYSAGTNGGIVGTVTYDTTRNELDPADAATEPYQPGIAGVPVNLYLPKPCTSTDPAVVANSCRQGKAIVPLSVPDPNDVTKTITNPDPQRGAFVKGPQVQDSYSSEEWSPPRGCTARQYNGTILTDQQALPPYGAAANAMCVEAPMMGIATGPSDSTPGNASQTVNGNYGFSTSKINLYLPGNAKNPAPARDLPQYAALHCPADQTIRDSACAQDALYDYPDQDLPALDYIVSVDIPKDPVDGKPMYKVTSEADVNVFDGDTFLPQENFAHITAGEAMNPPGSGTKNTPKAPSQPPSQQAGIISPCVGALHTVDVTDQAFLDNGGSPFQGQDRPYCTDKLVTVRSGQATAPNFNLFTDVPMPTHFWGLTLNDLGLSLDKRSANYGEAQGIPYVPVGLYDWSGRLVDTTHTDFNGLYEALEPSTDTFNCPVPAGPCPGMYRFVGNDPGGPGKQNADYNPRFRTIATNFQAWPGLYTVTDEAPTQVASTALAPGTTVANATQCDLAATTPQLLAVDKPAVRANKASTVNPIAPATSDADRTVTIRGFAFGSSGTLNMRGLAVTSTKPAGTPTVPYVLPGSWTDRSIKVVLPSGYAPGAAPIAISVNGQTSVNGLTIQVLGAANAANSTANPKLVEVAPLTDTLHPNAYRTVQAALEAAVPSRTTPYWLVAVYPNSSTTATPLGEWNENLIVHHQVKIQGVGPGGFDPTGTYVPGSILDGSGFNVDNSNGTNWITLLSGLNYSGDPAVPDAAVVTVLDDPSAGSTVPANYPTTIDGFTITGGAQSDIAANISDLMGGVKTPYGATGALITQGGGIYAHSNVRGLTVTDNVIRGNGGSYGGAIRLGTPYVGDNHNYNAVISRNQIRDNGGTNLAGGIGLFTGSNGYQVIGNAICGNFSAEYGGAISAFGYQGTGTGTSQSISNNRIWFNSSYDEGGAVMIAGELPADPAVLSGGSGAVSIDGNVIEANLANDDGGGIRLLQVSGSNMTSGNHGTISITNNTIVNNVSAHEGGGVALDDAAFVDFVNNTVAKNITTATAVTSDGTAAPAGLSTAPNSTALQGRLKTFSGLTLDAIAVSKPTLFNDLFWDNRAGNFQGGYVYGIGGTLPNGTANTVNRWDLGVVDASSIQLNPTNSVLSATPNANAIAATTTSTANSSGDPLFVKPFDIGVNILPSRMYPAFRQAVVVTEILPLSLLSNYHVAGTSSARNRGTATKVAAWSTTTTVRAPALDIDSQARPTGTRYDAGSDQTP